MTEEEKTQRFEKQATLIDILERVISDNNLKSDHLITKFLRSIKKSIFDDSSTPVATQEAMVISTVFAMQQLLGKVKITLPTEMSPEEKKVYILLRRLEKDTPEAKFLNRYYVLVNAVLATAQNSTKSTSELKTILEATLKFIRDSKNADPNNGNLLSTLESGLENLISSYEKKIEAQKQESEQIEKAKPVLEKIERISQPIQKFNRSLMDASIMSVGFDDLMDYFSSPAFIQTEKQNPDFKKLLVYDEKGDLDSEKTRDNMVDHFDALCGEGSVAGKLFNNSPINNLHKQNLSKISELLSTIEKHLPDFISHTYNSAIAREKSKVGLELKESAQQTNIKTKELINFHENEITRLQKELEGKQKEYHSASDKFSTELNNYQKMVDEPLTYDKSPVSLDTENKNLQTISTSLNQSLETKKAAVTTANTAQEQAKKEAAEADARAKEVITKPEPIKPFNFTSQKEAINAGKLGALLKNNTNVSRNDFDNWKNENLNKDITAKAYVSQRWYSPFGRIAEFFVKRFSTSFDKFHDTQVTNADNIYQDYETERTQYKLSEENYSVRLDEYKKRSTTKENRVEALHTANSNLTSQTLKTQDEEKKLEEITINKNQFDELNKKFNAMVQTDHALLTPDKTTNQSFLTNLQQIHHSFQEKFQGFVNKLNSESTPEKKIATITADFIKQLDVEYSAMEIQLKNLSKKYQGFEARFLEAKRIYLSARLQSNDYCKNNLPDQAALDEMESNLKQCKAILEDTKTLAEKLSEFKVFVSRAYGNFGPAGIKKTIDAITDEINAEKKKIIDLQKTTEVTPKTINDELSKRTHAVTATFFDITENLQKSSTAASKQQASDVLYTQLVQPSVISPRR